MKHDAASAARWSETPEYAVHVPADLYEAAERIADMRSETVEQEVARALKRYARGRTRPRH